MSDETPRVVFAIISSAPAASALLETVCEELVRRTSFAIEPVVLRSYDKLLGSMRDDEVHVAWAPPLVAIDLERENAARIRLCSRRAGRIDYSCVLFVKASSDIQTLAELKGKRVAWVAKESSAGYVVPRLKLLAEGFDPDDLFAEQTFRRTHEAVARVVLDGEADVGATYASYQNGAKQPVTAGWVEAGAKNEDVRALATAGPIPSDVIAMSTKLDTDKADQITAAMRELGPSIKVLLNADSFEKPEESHFDELRKLVDHAKTSRTT
jgi:phosphonate transport system substrate-binding protein